MTEYSSGFIGLYGREIPRTTKVGILVSKTVGGCKKSLPRAIDADAHRAFAANIFSILHKKIPRRTSTTARASRILK